MDKVNTKRIAIILALIVLLILVMPIAFYHLTPKKVEFNQFLLQDLESEYNTATAEMKKDEFLSKYSLGKYYLLNSVEDEPEGLENPEKIFSYVFSNVPPYAIVYPTEGFYYFSTSVNGAPIAGNIRIADLDKGRISFAYFTIIEGVQKETWITEFTEEDGLEIEKRSDYAYTLGYNGKKVKFKIPTTDFTPPEKITLIPGEKFMGQIHDESGVRLFLIYNENTTSFYEILNDEGGVTDSFREIEENYLIGKRTGFIFYDDKDYGRKILIATPVGEAEENNYLDGPGDQVPFRIKFRDEVNTAYPSTLLDAGTDEHGVYLNKTEWVRIAVSPYYKYSNPLDAVNRVNGCSIDASRTIFWTCITKEWWNTPEWREDIYSKLRNEGKNVSENIYQVS